MRRAPANTQNLNKMWKWDQSNECRLISVYDAFKPFFIDRRKAH